MLSLKQGKSVENVTLHFILYFYTFCFFLFEFFYCNWLKGKVIARKTLQGHGAVAG